MSKEDNLTPFDSERAKVAGSKGGKAKAGSKHLSTIIRDVLSDIDWSKTTLKNKEELQQKYGKNGWKAIVYVAHTKAMTGDTQAMKWLAENGFGKNIDITSGGEPFNIIVSKPYAKPTFRTDTEANDSRPDEVARDSS